MSTTTIYAIVMCAMLGWPGHYERSCWLLPGPDWKGLQLPSTVYSSLDDCNQDLAVMHRRSPSTELYCMKKDVPAWQPTE